MSADRARTMGLTARDIAEALADTPIDEESEPASTPRLGWGAPAIGADIPAWLDDQPAAWRAFGEPRKEQT